MHKIKYFIFAVFIFPVSQLFAMPPHPDIVEQYRKNGELKSLMSRIESMNSKLNMNSPLKSFPSSGDRHVPVLLVNFVTSYEATYRYSSDIGNIKKLNISIYWLLLILAAYILILIKKHGSPDRVVFKPFMALYLFLLAFFISCGVSKEEDEESFPTDPSVYSKFLNGDTLSVRKYYKDMSHNNLNLIFDIYGPVRVSKTWSYYGENDASGNDMHAAELVSEALRLMVSKYQSVDFRQYNNDGDSYVDAVIIIHEGPGEESGGGAGTIWSHQWDLVSAGYGAVPTGDGVSFNVYTIQPEYTFRRGDSSMGVYAHEFGHVLGLPDLYDTDGSTNGVGNWSLMGNGSWMGPGGAYNGITPAPLLAWERLKAGGTGTGKWVTVEEITSNVSNQSIYNIETPGIAYKVMLDSAVGQEQYLLLEGKVQSTSTQWYIAGTGVMITHIHEGVVSYYTSTDKVNAGTNGTRVHGINIIEADGGSDLWSKSDRGSASDLFTSGGVTNMIKYTGTSPSYPKSSFSATTIDISNISVAASPLSMKFDITGLQ